MSIHAALSEICPAESCLLTIRIHKHADGTLGRPIFLLNGDGFKLLSGTLAGLVEQANQNRERSEVDEVLAELETV